MKEEKRRVVVTVLTVMLLIIIFSGVTYAYFTATNNQGSTSLITVTGGKMTITYKDGNSSLLVSKEITPSNEIRVDKTFTLTGTNTTSGLAMPYKVGIKYTNGFSNGQLYYYIKRTTSNSNITSNLIGKANQTIAGHPSETGYTKGIFIKSSNETYLELAKGKFKAGTSNQTITFNLKIQFPDNNENQDTEKGKSFSGYIVINNEEETAVDYIVNLYNQDKINNGLLMDDTKDANIRYSGSNPNNYVEFGNTRELWRIIGIFDVKDSETGEYQKKIKLVRNEPLGNYSWDATGNNNYGINDWTDADLMKELNGDYLDTTLTANTQWYNSHWSSSGPVFRRTGIFDYTKVIKTKYQQLISESVWNLGANSWNNPSESPYGLPTKGQYEAERGNVTYQNRRPIVWTGKIALIYASDYGYASTDTECRKDLRAGLTLTDNKIDATGANCKNNNWLYRNTNYLTISPCSWNPGFAFYQVRSGNIDNNGSAVYLNMPVFPSLYLSSDIKIISGEGISSNAYQLG